MSNDVTGMAGMTQGQIEELVTAEYARLRAAWFPAAKPAWLADALWAQCQQPSTIEFVWDAPGGANCGYIFAQNRLIIAAEEGWQYMASDLDEGEEPTAVYATNAQGIFTRDWLPWRVFLLHEMCHEYQFKVFRNHDISPVGREMYHEICCAATMNVKWSPTGLHPTPFLAAINELAVQLGASRVALYNRL